MFQLCNNTKRYLKSGLVVRALQRGVEGQDKGADEDEADDGAGVAAEVSLGSKHLRRQNNATEKIE
jgi:hypothetical protein